MRELDNFKIEDISILLNEDTTLKRYYPLIPQEYVPLFRAFLHLHDFKERKLSEATSIDSAFLQSLSKKGIKIIEDILLDDSDPVGCMALTDLDLKYWSDIPKGESLYLHKLAVKRSYAGIGAADKLINFAKKLAHDRGINSIRLDFNKKRDKLRQLYERNGFRYVKEKKVSEDYSLDLYVCNNK